MSKEDLIYYGCLLLAILISAAIAYFNIDTMHIAV